MTMRNHDARFAHLPSVNGRTVSGSCGPLPLLGENRTAHRRETTGKEVAVWAGIAGFWLYLGALWFGLV